MKHSLFIIIMFLSSCSLGIDASIVDKCYVDSYKEHIAIVKELRIDRYGDENIVYNEVDSLFVIWKGDNIISKNKFKENFQKEVDCELYRIEYSKYLIRSRLNMIENRLDKLEREKK